MFCPYLLFVIFIILVAVVGVEYRPFIIHVISNKYELRCTYRNEESLEAFLVLDFAKCVLVRLPANYLREPPTLNYDMTVT